MMNGVRRIIYYEVIILLYVNDSDMLKNNVNWHETIDVIRNAIDCILSNNISQPIKPYLRFKDLTNRIIAMPAYVGGNVDVAGIKWIASFPKNIEKSIPRASSVTVLNDSNTGIPIAIFNTAMISIIRTASVSGYLLKKYIDFSNYKKYNIGIIGFGPIGQNHLEMCQKVLGNGINKTFIYDRRKISCSENEIICSSWQDVYNNVDILITCTSTLNRYINIPNSKCKLILDVSLRDFDEKSLDCFSKPFIVDNWEEVNRENTDIDYYKKLGKINKNQTVSLCDIQLQGLNYYFDKNDAIFFAPMGMAAFDIAIAHHYYNEFLNKGIGLELK